MPLSIPKSTLPPLWAFLASLLSWLNPTIPSSATVWRCIELAPFCVLRAIYKYLLNCLRTEGSELRLCNNRSYHNVATNTEAICGEVLRSHSVGDV